MKAILVRPEAEADIDSSVGWYEGQEPGLGMDFLDEARAMQLRIREFPLQFPEVSARVRRALLDRFPFALYFLLDAETVVLFAVLHQRRDPSEWRSRLPPK